MLGQGLEHSCHHVICRNVQLGGVEGQASRHIERAGDSLRIQGTPRKSLKRTARLSVLLPACYISRRPTSSLEGASLVGTFGLFEFRTTRGYLKATLRGNM